MSSIAPHIEAFLREHLARHRAASAHTCDSYAYSFQSLFEFAARRLKDGAIGSAVGAAGRALDRRAFSSIWRVHAGTRRKRATSAWRRSDPSSALCSIANPPRSSRSAASSRSRTRRPTPGWSPTWTRTKLQALLDAPDPATREGIRDRAMLHLAVCAGLRVSELTGLRISDVAAQSKSIHVLGKGRRERALPLWKPTASALRAWLAVRGEVRHAGSVRQRARRALQSLGRRVRPAQPRRYRKCRLPVVVAASRSRHMS